MKLLVVGFDGLEPKLLESVYEQGDNFWQDLIDKGVFYKVRSEINQENPPSNWMSSYTGCDFEQHQIPDAWFSDKYTSSKDLRKSCWWEKANEEDIRTGLLNIPDMFPAQPTSGFLVSGFPSTKTFSRDACFPREAFNTIIRGLEGQGASPYEMDLACVQPVAGAGFVDIVLHPSATGFLVRPSPEHAHWQRTWLSQGQKKFFEAAESQEKIRLVALETLTTEFPVDALMVQFPIFDRLHHCYGFSEQSQPLSMKMLKFAEFLAGILIAKYKPENVVIYSVHGFENHTHTDLGSFIGYGPAFPVDPNRKEIQAKDVCNEILRALEVKM